MKKTLILLVAIIMLSLLTLTACGGGQTEAVTVPPPSEPQEVVEATVSDPIDTNETSPPEEEEAQPEPTFAFKYGDVLIEMDQDINYVLEKLGEPLGIFEAESCAFDGIDRIFRYPGMQLHTYPKGDNDFVHTISLRDDSLRTTEGGIRLGADIQDVIDAYGDDYEFDTRLYRFRRGMTTLEFITEDDMVVGITYGLIIDI